MGHDTYLTWTERTTPLDPDGVNQIHALTLTLPIRMHNQAVEAAADDLPGVLGVMKAHLEAQNSGGCLA